MNYKNLCAYLTLLLIWASGLAFICYILDTYFLHIFSSKDASNMIPDVNYPIMNKIFMSIHFIGGVIIMLIGPLQFVSKMRKIQPSNCSDCCSCYSRYGYLNFHKWNGRLYLTSCFVTGLAGITFICVNGGTVCGPSMTVAFSTYGILLIVFSLITWNYARQFGKCNIQYNTDESILLKLKLKHRDWALRTFALGLGSWFYRALYVFTYLCTSYSPLDTDSKDTVFRHPVDYVFDWLFFLLPLLFTEVLIRYIRRHDKSGTTVNYSDYGYLRL